MNNERKYNTKQHIKTMLLLAVLSFSFSKTCAQTYEIADSLWNEAEKAADLKDYLKAADLFEKSADAELKCTEPREEDLYYEWASASYCYHQANRYDQAFEMRKKSLEQCINVFGKEHEKYGFEAAWVGLYYELLGQYDEALPLYLEALENTEKSLGKDHSEYRTYLNNLAGLYKNMEQYDKALALYISMWEYLKKSEEYGNLKYIKHLNNIIELYEKLNNIEDAIPYHKEVLAYNENKMGKESHAYGSKLNDIGMLYYNLNDFMNAITFFEKSLFIFEKLNGKNHLNYGVLSQNLALSNSFLNRIDKAFYYGLISLRVAEVNSEIIDIVDLEERNDFILGIIGNLPEMEDIISYRQCIEIATNILGENHKNVVVLYGNYASILYLEKDYENARVYYLKTLELIDNIKNVDVVASLVYSANLATLYKVTGNFDSAYIYYERSFNLIEKHDELDFIEHLYIPQQAGYLYIENERFDLAIDVFKRIENRLKIMSVCDTSYYISTLETLGKLFEKTKQYDIASQYFGLLAKLYQSNNVVDERYLKIILDNADNLIHMGNLIGAESFLKIFVANFELSSINEIEKFVVLYSKLAKLFSDINDFNRALEFYSEILNRIEFESYKLLYFKCLINMGAIHFQKSDFKNAVFYYELSAEKYALLDVEDFDLDFPYYLNMIQLYHKIGNFSKALNYSHYLTNIVEKAKGIESKEYDEVSFLLSEIYLDLGNYNKAIELALKSYEFAFSEYGENNNKFIQRLNFLAVIYERFRFFDQSIELIKQAIEVSFRNEMHDNLSPLYTNLARLYEVKLDLDLDSALYYYNKALKLVEREKENNQLEYSTLHLFLANLYHSKGEWDKAELYYLLANQMNVEFLGIHHPNTNQGEYLLGKLYEEMNRSEEAFAIYLKNAENNLNRIRQNFSFMSEKEKEQFVKTVDINFKAYQSFFTRYAPIKPEVASNAYDIELATKGMILQSGIEARQAIMNSGDSIAITKFEEWTLLRSILAKQYSLPIAERRKDLKEIEEKAEKAESELSRLSAAFREQKEANHIRWQQVQQALKPGEVAIEFASFQYCNDKEWTDSTLYIALVLRPGDKHPHLVPLFEQKQLDSILLRSNTESQRGINQLYRGVEVVRVNQVSLPKGQLYQLLWKPLEHLIEPGQKIYFAPSGSLHQVAFAAITDPNGKHLSEVYTLEQLTTTAKLTEKEETFKAQSIALFGGIAYDTDTSVLHSLQQEFISQTSSSVLLAQLETRGGELWNYLPGTLSEIQGIDKLAQAAKLGTWVYSGDSALEERFKGINSPSILHIATHGFFFPDPKIENKNPLVQMEETNLYKASDNPLQRSGLLFSGANHTWQGNPVPAGMEDGILTAYEVTQTNLSNTHLVVLSACETGLGDIKGSEGVFGLQRSFKAAGAEYLLMSLWKVPDIETAAFMTHFYSLLFAGKTIPESFHQTQNYMQQQHPKDPYKWAAFVLVR